MSGEPHLKLVPIPTGEEPDDLSLARAAGRGEPGAMNALLGRVFDRVRRTTSYLARDRDDAEDLLQLALIEIARSVGGFRGDSSLERWVDRVSVRTAGKQFARRARRERLLDLSGGLPPRQAAPADEAADRDRVRRRLAELLARLSAKNRAVLVLHYLWGYGVAEIAEIAECRENTVRGRVREGRRQLRDAVLGDPLLSSWVERRRK